MTDAVRGALLWVASFAFACGVFFCLALLLREIDGVDVRNERPLRHGALQPPFAASEDEHAECVADEPAIRP